MHKRRASGLNGRPKPDPIAGVERLKCSDEEATQFALDLFRMRDDVRESFGDKYAEMITPVMEGLRNAAQLEGRSLLKQFEHYCAPLLKIQDDVGVWILGAAVIELYELRQRTFPGIGNG